MLFINWSLSEYFGLSSTDTQKGNSFSLFVRDERYLNDAQYWSWTKWYTETWLGNYRQTWKGQTEITRFVILQVRFFLKILSTLFLFCFFDLGVNTELLSLMLTTVYTGGIILAELDFVLQWAECYHSIKGWQWRRNPFNR